MRDTKATGHSVLAFFINPPGISTSKSGLIRLNDDGQTAGIRTRWFRIHSVGDNNVVSKDINAGDIVAVPHGRWTRGFDCNHPDGKLLYGLDPADILGVYNGNEEDLDLA